MEQTADAGIPVAPVVENKQKSGNGLKIATAIACIVAVCGIGFGVYGMMRSSQKDSQADAPKDETATVSDNSDTLSLKQVKDLLNKYVSFDYNVTSTENNLFENGLTEQYKYYLSLKSLNYADKISATHEDAGTPSGDTADYEYSFTYDDINDAYHSLFGSGSNVQNQENFWCFVPFYSAEYNKYISITRCGGVDSSTYAYEILDYSVDDNKLTTDIAYIHIFDDYTGGEWKKYIALSNGNEEISGDSSNYLGATYLREHEDDLPKYQLTFEKEGSDYIFTNVSKL